ncbi:hydratase [Leisingera aquaemixtae]|uniref:2-keto-4-pentenoate hydratase n=1 Tax=Leisingera aquaemixtae TaxID=1396826 RepID=UPI001C987513|nr:fumarylacetoacetate hydrolase family protein [Leisingera aquaemixtae]MBY6066089.1 hydratase [Leisingera aquaemixtae]
MLKPLLAACTITLSVSLAAPAAWPACATDGEITVFVESFTAKTPAQALSPGGSMQDALCSQAKLAAALEPHMGPVIGYKAGLTSKPAQDRFGATEPVQGLLFRNMMLEDGAALDAPWGAIPMVEADLVLVVADEAINTATTPEEALAHISAVRPFIELPDLTLAKGQPFTAETITAMGVGTRLGILGAPVAVEDPAAMARMLEEMSVTMRDAAGGVLVQAPGRAVLGNPVNAALWLRSKGVEFKAGDLISVGSFGPLFPPRAGKGGVSVTYDGLPGNPVVRVQFKE